MGCRELHIEENHPTLKVVHRSETPVKKDVQAFFFSSEKAIVDDYRYGFNGMEKDDEVSGQRNSYTTTWRQYDPRIARWKSVDPKDKLQPWQSPYSAMDNAPIWKNDPNGDIAPIVIGGYYIAAEIVAFFYAATAVTAVAVVASDDDVVAGITRAVEDGLTYTTSEPFDYTAWNGKPNRAQPFGPEGPKGGKKIVKTILGIAAGALAIQGFVDVDGDGSLDVDYNEFSKSAEVTAENQKLEVTSMEAVINEDDESMMDIEITYNKTYEIQEGDKLEILSEKFDISIEDLMDMNDFIENPDSIYAGDVLNLGSDCTITTCSTDEIKVD